MRGVCWGQATDKWGVTEEEEEVCSRPELCFGEIQGSARCWDGPALPELPAALFPAVPRSVRSEQSRAGYVEGVGQKIRS